MQRGGAPSRLGQLVRKFSRFLTGSAVATGCSQATFLLLFGVVGTSAAVAAATGFVAGAVPNFVLQRYWTWKRSGRVGVRGELIPYVAVVTFNGLAATGLTALTDRLIMSTIDDHATRTVLLALAFGASYGLLLVVKFALLDRLVFGSGLRRVNSSRTQVPTMTRQ